MATMSKVMSRSLDKPDEQVEKGGVKIDIVYLGDIKVKRATYPSGWKFSTDMGADRCQDNHIGYVIKGRMTVRHDDGTEIDTKEGDVFVIPANHDAWAHDETTIVQFDEFDGAARRFGL
jgi:ethanolamine utilization protein EutQ (cupin superfamily)